MFRSLVIDKPEGLCYFICIHNFATHLPVSWAWTGLTEVPTFLEQIETRRPVLAAGF